MPTYPEHVAGAALLAAVSTVSLSVASCDAQTKSVPTHPQTCPACEGRGRLMHGGGVAASLTECTLCKGTGEVMVAEGACERCAGVGEIVCTESLYGSTISSLTKKTCPSCHGSGKKEN